MRNIKTKLIPVIMVCALCAACSDMNELGDRFLKNGETTYAAMPDSVAVGAGRNRVRLGINIKNNRVKTSRIYWNNFADSTDVEIGNTNGVFSKTIENLPEQSHVFNIVNFDRYGNKSLIYEISGQALGEKYESALTNRQLISTALNKSGNKILTWGSVDETPNALYTEVFYLNVNDEQVIRKIPLTETTTEIPGKPGTTPLYRTIFIPDEMAVDSFYANFIACTPYLLYKPEWTILKFSSEHNNDEHAARNVIDGNYNNQWHTLASSDYPHWMALDLGGALPVSRFSIWASVFAVPSFFPVYDNRLPASLTLWGRLDAPDSYEFSEETGWIKLGAYTCANRAGEQLFVIANPVPVRYFAFYAPSGIGTTIMVLGEIDIYVE